MREVVLENLLSAPEQGVAPMQWAEATGDYGRVSRPLPRSPHVEFLREFVRRGTSILALEDFRQSAYFRNAQQCIDLTGRYSGHSDLDGILQRARMFIELYLALREIRCQSIDFTSTAPFTGSLPPTVQQTLSRGTHQIVDGQHRLAAALVAGATKARVACFPVRSTSLQSLVLQVSQTEGRRELYQEIDSPEFDSSWHVVRRCNTRFQMMLNFLRERRYPLQNMSVLDLACSYGWFAAEFAKLGCKVLGVERDPVALRIGQIAYALKPQWIVADNIESFLANCDQKFDITLFLSLLHHYGRLQELKPEAILRQVDRITGSCMFLDSGEQHERWHKIVLREWTPGYISHLITTHTSFRHVIPLGTDKDNWGPYRNQYRRTLFACVR